LPRTTASALCRAAHSLQTLVLFRALQGIGNALLAVSAAMVLACLAV
jgi:hypothetical protein